MKLLKYIKHLSLACMLSLAFTSCGDLIEDLNISEKEANKTTSVKLMEFSIDGRMKSYRNIKSETGEIYEEYVLYPNTYFTFPSVGAYIVDNGVVTDYKYGSMIYYDINGKSPANENQLLSTAKKLTVPCGIDDTKAENGGYKFSVDRFLAYYPNHEDGLEVKFVMQKPNSSNPTTGGALSAVSHKFIKVEKADISYVLEGKLKNEIKYKEIQPKVKYENGIHEFALEDGDYRLTVTSQSRGYKTVSENGQTRLEGPELYGRLHLSESKGGYTNDMPELSNYSYDELADEYKKVVEFKIDSTNIRENSYQEVDIAAALIGENGIISDKILLKCKQSAGQLVSELISGGFVSEADLVATFMPGTRLKYSLNVSKGTDYDIYYTTDGSDPITFENDGYTLKGYSNTAKKYTTEEQNYTIEQFIEKYAPGQKIIRINARAVINNSIVTPMVSKYATVLQPELTYELRKGHGQLSDKVEVTDYDDLENGKYTIVFNRPNAVPAGSTTYGPYGTLKIKQYKGDYKSDPELGDWIEIEGNKFEFEIDETVKQNSIQVCLEDALGIALVPEFSHTFMAKTSIGISMNAGGFIEEKNGVEYYTPGTVFKVNHSYTGSYKIYYTIDGSSPAAGSFEYIEQTMFNADTLVEAAGSTGKVTLKVLGVSGDRATPVVEKTFSVKELTVGVELRKGRLSSNGHKIAESDYSKLEEGDYSLIFTVPVAKKAGSSIYAPYGDFELKTYEGAFKDSPDKSSVIYKTLDDNRYAYEFTVNDSLKQLSYTAKLKDGIKEIVSNTGTFRRTAQISLKFENGAYVKSENGVEIYLPGTKFKVIHPYSAGSNYHIYYTTDGSDPSISGTRQEYNDSAMFDASTIANGGNVTLRVKAVFDNEWTNEVAKSFTVKNASEVSGFKVELYDGDTLVSPDSYSDLEAGKGTYKLVFKMPKAKKAGSDVAEEYGRLNVTAHIGAFTDTPDYSTDLTDLVVNNVLSLAAREGQATQGSFKISITDESGVKISDDVYITVKTATDVSISMFKGAFVSEAAGVETYMPGTVFKINHTLSGSYSIYYTVDGTDPKASGTRLVYDEDAMLDATALSEAATATGGKVILKVVGNISGNYTEVREKRFTVKKLDPTDPASGFSVKLLKDGTEVTTDADKLVNGTYTVDITRPTAVKAGTNETAPYGTVKVKYIDGGYTDSSVPVEKPNWDNKFTIDDTTKQVHMIIDLVDDEGNSLLVNPIEIKYRRELSVPEYLISHYSIKTGNYRWIKTNSSRTPTAESYLENSVPLNYPEVHKTVEGGVVTSYKVPGGTRMLFHTNSPDAEIYYEISYTNDAPADPTSSSSKYSSDDPVLLDVHFKQDRVNETGWKAIVKAIAKEGPVVTEVSTNTFEIEPDAIVTINANYRKTGDQMVPTISSDESKTFYGQFNLGYYITDEVYDVIDAGLYTDMTYSTFAIGTYGAPLNVKPTSKVFYDDFGPLIRIQTLDGYLYFDMRVIDLTSGSCKIYKSNSAVPYTGKSWKDCKYNKRPVSDPYHSCSGEEHADQPKIYDLYNAWSPFVLPGTDDAYLFISATEIGEDINCYLMQLNDVDEEWSSQNRNPADYQ